ncbi:MAG: efflux RND transporter permease subunit [Prevotella sp.]
MSKRKRNIIESVMHYNSIMLLLMVVLIGFGVFALINMPKNEFPSFTIRQGVVAAVYPGATSAEVEEQVTKPLETFLWGFKEIKKNKTRSQTKDGITYIFVELNDDVANKDEFWSKFKIKLQQFKVSLPQGVLALIANDDFGDTSAMLITLESKTKSYRELHEYMNTLKDNLRTIPELANLRVSGEQGEEIGVYIDRDKLSDYGINSATLLANLSAQGMTMVSGKVDDGQTTRPIHLRSQMNTENDVANRIVYSDPRGNVIRLRDIATIKREYPHADKYVKNNGQKCIVLSVEMNEGSNIVQFGNKVKDIMGQFEASLPQDVSIYTITDQSEVVNSSVVDFLKELLIAIASVVVVIMLLLPMRVASVAASTIPITIFITLGLFYALGLELNTVTLASLIVALGMIVDNSIVIIDSYIEKIDEGMSRWHAATYSAKEFFSSIFSATLAISITFFPLLLTMKGMMKDFVKWFPLGISVVLGASLLVAVLVVPWMQFTFIRKGLKKEGKGEGKQRRTFLDIMQSYYDRLIERCFAHPFITLGVGVLSVVVGAVLFASMPQKLMPRAERNQFAVEIYLPQGTSIERTAAVADSLRDMMQTDKRIRNISTFYGMSSPRFQTSYAPQLGGTNYAQFIVNTESDAATMALVDSFTTRYTDHFAEAQVRIKQLDYSDASSPVEIRFSGDDLNAIHQAVDSATRRMRAMPELLLVRNNFDGATAGLDVQIDDYEASRLGMSKSLLALNLATRFGDGVPLTTVWEADYPVKVMLKDSHAGQQTPEDLENATVSGLLPGVNVPLRQVAKVSPDWTYTSIHHRNGVRSMSVMADAKRGLNLNSVTDKVIDEVKKIELPQGVTMSVGGQREKDLETEPQIYSGLAISIIIIFAILLFHFKDIRMSMVIMLSLLFSLLGAATGVLIMGQEVGITGILGIISLMGIIVRNGIIMIDYAEELRVDHRLSAKRAALQAAQRRMRPIFLTSAAASMGVIPMVIANTPLWGPMGVVVCFGTIVSLLFIVTMIPIGYWMVFRWEDRKRTLKMEASSRS